MPLSKAEIEARQARAAKLAAKKKDVRKDAKKQAKRTAGLKAKLKEVSGEKKRTSIKRKVRKSKEKLENYGEDRTILRKKIKDALTYQETIKGTAGVKNPTVNPFLNGEDLSQLSSARTAYKDKTDALNYALENLRLDTNYEKSQVDEKSRRDLSSVNDDAARRGIFKSSIRDASLFDIDAATGIAKGLLDTELERQMFENQAQERAASQAFDEVQAAMYRKAVDNAREVALDVGIYKVKPTADKTVDKKLEMPDAPKKPDKPFFTPTPGSGQKPSLPDSGRGNEGKHTGSPHPGGPGGRGNKNKPKDTGKKGPNLHGPR